ncbi:MAG: MFS transporter, partial [Chloroflexi bacterium]|nr:MFS transporter [Chloroflexota bacterium]
MIFASLFAPKADLSESDRRTALRMLKWQVIAGAGADGLASGGFLVAFALILGANNTQIGLMTALPFLAQPVQILAVALVERLRMRKAIGVTAYFIQYGVWVPIALIPFVIDVPNALAVSALLVLITVRGTAAAFLNAAWNGWLRDLVPQNAMGAFFAQRLRVSTLAAAIVALAAAFYIDWWKDTASEDNIIFGYSYAILIGALLFGWTAVGFMSRIPEPRMAASPGPRAPIIKSLSAPYSDRNFRHLVNFLFLWNFATHLAIPFFAVYMLKVIGIPLSAVVALAVLSQVVNVLFLRVWGPLVDRLGSKVV